jgi:hypothetical protein
MYSTREEWLVAAIEELRPMFMARATALPSRIRVTCGFPSTAARSGAVGQCFADTASADQHYEILISPVLDQPARVFNVLVHELCHTLPGCMNHGRAFQTAAAAMPLVPNPSWKATVAGPVFAPAYDAIIQSLGPYPHAEVSLGTRKKQTTRLLKAVCPDCGYVIRLTRLHADKGLPTCSLDGVPFRLA